MTQKDPLISAQVVLRTRSGKVAGGTDSVTAETVADFEAAPETAAHAIDAFRKLGFTAGPVVGNSFSISASQQTFDKVFNTDVAAILARRAKAKSTSRKSSNELPLKKLPKPLTALVTAVTFTPPPDFGPGNFA